MGNICRKENESEPYKDSLKSKSKMTIRRPNAMEFIALDSFIHETQRWDYTGTDSRMFLPRDPQVMDLTPQSIFRGYDYDLIKEAPNSIYPTVPRRLDKQFLITSLRDVDRYFKYLGRRKLTPKIGREAVSLRDLSRWRDHYDKVLQNEVKRRHCMLVEKKSHCVRVFLGFSFQLICYYCSGLVLSVFLFIISYF